MQRIKVQALTNRMKTYTGDHRPYYVERLVISGDTVFINWQDGDDAPAGVTEHDLGDSLMVEVFD